MKLKKGTLFILLGIFFVGIGGTVWYGLSQNNEPINYTSVKVIRGYIEDTVTAQGTIQPSQYVDVGVQVSGQLKQLNVTLGQYVTAGDLLAQIDPAIYESNVVKSSANLENLNAQLKSKEAQFQLARKQYSRNQLLLKDFAIPEKDVEVTDTSYKTIQADIEGLKAQIKQAEADFEIAKANLSYTNIRAPISGTIVQLPARQGQTLNANQLTPLVLRIANMGIVTVWAQVSEADILKVKVGQEVYFTVIGSPDKKWSGKVKEIYPTPELINTAIFYDVIFDVPNSDMALKIQMTVQAFFILNKANSALIIPASALQFAEKKLEKIKKEKNDPRKNVMILKEDGSTELRKITIGITTPISVEVLSGLKEGENVITGIAKNGKEPNKSGTGGRKFY